MSTFYVIPPRECLEQAVAELLGRVLPGLPVEPGISEALLSAVEFEANRYGDVYLVHREDLPGTRDVVNDLIEAFGAEPGDRVIEVSATTGGRKAQTRQCTVKAVSATSAAR